MNRSSSLFYATYWGAAFLVMLAAFSGGRQIATAKTDAAEKGAPYRQPSTPPPVGHRETVALDSVKPALTIGYLTRAVPDDHRIEIACRYSIAGGCSRDVKWAKGAAARKDGELFDKVVKLSRRHGEEHGPSLLTARADQKSEFHLDRTVEPSQQCRDHHIQGNRP